MLLIVDDDSAVQTSISLLLEEKGYATGCASNPGDALEILKSSTPKLVLLDLNFGNDTSGREGLDFLTTLKRIIPEVPVILITAWGSISLAVEGIKKGAFDFVSKPWKNENLLQVISTALELTELPKQRETISRKALDKKYDFTNIVGNSKQLVSILETAGRVSKTEAVVLILGESGTGKELIAEAIHNNSNRKSEPFIKVNLGGLSSTLFESELFGHKKGAFTDAYNDRVGRFELANGGTIFLDEIGDLDMRSQVKMLRVLQDKTYQVLGDSITKKLDVRVICATNRNLQDMVAKGTFREDLFYRINLITLNVPPLRARQGDVSLLINHFLVELSLFYNVENISVNQEALNWLENMHFPGNVREIKNLLERTWLISGKNELGITELKSALEIEKPGAQRSDLPPYGQLTLEEMEKRMIQNAMDKHKNNISKVAKVLGLSRGTLYRRLEKYGIPFE